MKCTSIASVMNIQTLQLIVVTLLMFLTNARAKKLCDVRIWYLNIITADVFNADLSDEQMSLKESIEALVMNSADNRDTRMVDCNVLYMYNDMLNEHFNYVSSSGMAMKEIDSKKEQESNEDAKDPINEYTDKDLSDASVNEDVDEANRHDAKGELKPDVSEHGNENEGDLYYNNELADEIQENNNGQEYENQQKDSDNLSTSQKDDENKSEYMETTNEEDTPKDVYQDHYDHNDDDIDKLDMKDTVGEDDDIPNQFIDLSNEYMDSADDTEIDDTETDDETVEHNVHLTDNVNDNIPERKNKSSIRRGPVALGVCWSLGCSTYDVFVFNTKDENTIGTLKQKELSSIRPSRLRLETKKFKRHSSCTLIYFYELIFINTICVNNYSIGEQLQKRAILESDITNEPLPYSGNTQDVLITENLQVPDPKNRLDDSTLDNTSEKSEVNEIDNLKDVDSIDELITSEVTGGTPIREGNNEKGKKDDISSDYKPEINIINKRAEEEDDVVMNDGKTTNKIINNKNGDESVSEEDNNKAKQAPNLTVDIEISNSEEQKSKSAMESFEEFEKIIEQKTNKYYNKIQSLEVMIMKLENTLLSEALHKQNHSSTITKLENHILKLENELLKMNKNYQNLRDDADNMSKRQNKYLELAYKQQAKQEYPELPDHTTKSHELISQHQSKLNELAFVLKNQSKMIMLLQEKYESLEDQNRQLHQMVMNQTIFMTSIIKTVQDLSEQNIQNQKEIIALKQKVEEKNDKPTQIVNPGIEHSKPDVIDELDSLLFHNRDEKLHSVPTGHINIEKTIDKLDNSDRLLQKYMMNKKSANELVSGWCPKSTKTCPLCQSISLVKTNCIPFQFLIWSYDTKNMKQGGSTAVETLTIDIASSRKSNTNEPYFTAEHFADDDFTRGKDTSSNIKNKLKDLTVSLEAKADSKEEKETEEVPIESNNVYKNEDIIDKLPDAVDLSDAKADSNINKETKNGPITNNIADDDVNINSKLHDATVASDTKLGLNENEYTEEAPIANDHIYDDMYEHMGYDKEGKPVWKMRITEPVKDDTQEEITKATKDDPETSNDKKSEADNIDTDKANIMNNPDGIPEKIDKTSDKEEKTNAGENNLHMAPKLDETKTMQKSKEDTSDTNKENIMNNGDDMPEKIDKETYPSKISDKKENTNTDANEELKNIPNKLNENNQLGDNKPFDQNKITQEINKDGKEINADPDTKETQKPTNDTPKEELTINEKNGDVSKLKADKLSKDSPEKLNTLNDNQGTDATPSNTKVKQSTVEETLERDSDVSKTPKTKDTVSGDLSQDTYKQKLKNNEPNNADKGEKAKEIKISEEKQQNNQQQKVDRNSQEKDDNDSNRNVNATKNVVSKAKEAANKPKERKVPINLHQTVHEPKDCYDYYTRGDKRDGIYKVKPVGSERTVEVFCDMRKGGWTVIQRRQDGYTNFFQEWAIYKKGFGGLYGEHWLGNDNIHLLTNQGYYKLHVDLMDWDKVKKYAEFDYFLVESEAEGYRVHIDGYQGDAGDGLTKHDGHKFSTKDVDNDKVVKEFGGSCAKRFYGAGWYYKCYASNLNGKYYKGGKIPDKKYDGVTWKPWTGPNYSLKKVEMKIRPASVKK